MSGVSHKQVSLHTDCASKDIRAQAGKAGQGFQKSRPHFDDQRSVSGNGGEEITQHVVKFKPWEVDSPTRFVWLLRFSFLSQQRKNSNTPANHVDGGAWIIDGSGRARERARDAISESTESPNRGSCSNVRRTPMKNAAWRRASKSADIAPWISAMVSPNVTKLPGTT